MVQALPDLVGDRRLGGDGLGRKDLAPGEHVIAAHYARRRQKGRRHAETIAGAAKHALNIHLPNLGSATLASHFFRFRRPKCSAATHAIDVRTSTGVPAILPLHK